MNQQQQQLLEQQRLLQQQVQQQQLLQQQFLQQQHPSQSPSGEARMDDDAQLAELLSSLIDYTPTIPDDLVEFYLGKSGFQCPDLRLPLRITGSCQGEETLVPHRLSLDAFRSLIRMRQTLNRRTRLIAVATQKFISEVASDALQHCKARQATVVKDKHDKKQKDKRLVLTMEDLSKALREYGVNMKHPDYFAENPSTGIEPASREK